MRQIPHRLLLKVHTIFVVSDSLNNSPEDWRSAGKKESLFTFAVAAFAAPDDKFDAGIVEY
jgi:hypothetical protein